MENATIRIRLDRALIEELRTLAGEGVDISELIETEIRALILRLKSGRSS
ncbi:MAG: hypothetical protein NVSMB64_32220 [Candidatus Velthaea sp.]